ncbi:hypothetical protein SD70_01945 [Gordoniibacillus kamchatkensis]|uniref:Uncharacterized protein n=1 Tax=Gordoniibacillus kamchatkensis TaxID=1590651 RepID=A0ABR5AMP4_9BACL|nr:hypothetical protein SD70_01945 [Paenibacillus sp. VKM B-2647]
MPDEVVVVVLPPDEVEPPVEVEPPDEVVPPVTVMIRLPLATPSTVQVMTAVPGESALAKPVAASTDTIAGLSEDQTAVV